MLSHNSETNHFRPAQSRQRQATGLPRANVLLRTLIESLACFNTPSRHHLTQLMNLHEQSLEFCIMKCHLFWNRSLSQNNGQTSDIRHATINVHLETLEKDQTFSTKHTSKSGEGGEFSNRLHQKLWPAESYLNLFLNCPADRPDGGHKSANTIRCGQKCGERCTSRSISYGTVK